MEILLIMFIGVLIARKWGSPKYKKVFEYLQLGATLLLVFALGASLGKMENLAQQIRVFGVDSLFLSIIPIIGSVLVVWWLSACFLVPRDNGESKEREEM